MSVNVVINGVTYAQPNQGTPPPWGDIQADIIVALVSSVLQKSGGTFTLTAEAYFGATYGLKSQYYKGPTANPASSGVLRLAVSEGMGWRNNANNGDLLLTVNGSNALLFNGVQLAVGTGDVAGPGSSTDNAVARFDSTTGKIIQNSGVIIDDSNNISGVGTLTAGGVLFSDKVTGPASSVDNTLPRFDSTTGKLIQTSGVSINDSDEIAGVVAINSLPIAFYQTQNIAVSTIADMTLSNSGAWELVTSATTLTLTVYDASKPVFVSVQQVKSAVSTDTTAATWATSGTLSFGVAVDLVGAIVAGTVIAARTSFAASTSSKNYLNVITGLSAASHTFQLCGLVPNSSSNTVEKLIFMVWQ